MVKHSQTIRWLPTNCLSVFDHFVGFVFKGLKFMVADDREIKLFLKFKLNISISSSQNYMLKSYFVTSSWSALQNLLLNALLSVRWRFQDPVNINFKPWILQKTLVTIQCRRFNQSNYTTNANFLRSIIQRNKISWHFIFGFVKKDVLLQPLFISNFKSSSDDEFKMSLYLISIQQKIAFSFMQL